MEASALRKQKDLLVQEVSEAVSAHRALHCAIRKLQETHDGVGMVLRLSGDKCAIKQIIPGSPAAQCGQLQVVYMRGSRRVLRVLLLHACFQARVYTRSHMDSCCCSGG
jgi:hypothetical protein